MCLCHRQCLCVHTSTSKLTPGSSSVHGLPRAGKSDRNAYSRFPHGNRKFPGSFSIQRRHRRRNWRCTAKNAPGFHPHWPKITMAISFRASNSSSSFPSSRTPPPGYRDANSFTIAVRPCESRWTSRRITYPPLGRARTCASRACLLIYFSADKEKGVDDDNHNTCFASTCTSHR